MKALSVRQPWAWLIAHGLKPVENREWETHYRGPVLIHASKTFSEEDFLDCQALVGIETGVRMSEQAAATLLHSG